MRKLMIKRLLLIGVLMFLIFSSEAIPGATDQANAASYEFKNIEIPGAFFSIATDINDAGHIVGRLAGSSGAHGFLYIQGNVTPIDVPFTGVTLTIPNGINNRGEIVGTYFVGTLIQRGFSESGGFFSRINVPFAGTTGVNGNQINNRGQIVGTYIDGSGQHGFLENSGIFTSIDDPDGPTEVYGINNRGQIVGDYLDTAGFHGFVMTAGDFFPLNFPGVTRTEARDINDHNEIVGIYTDVLENFHGFFYSNKTFTPIDVPGATSTVVNGINNLGQIVGHYVDGVGVHAFIAIDRQR